MAALCLSSCGRIGFDAVASDDASITDANSDSLDANTLVPDATMLVPTCENALFCSDFETPGFDDFAGQVMDQGGEIAEDTGIVLEGTRSARFRVLSGDQAVLRVDLPTLFESGELWVRVFAYTPTAYGTTAAVAVAYLVEPGLPRWYIDTTASTSDLGLYADPSDGEAIQFSGSASLADAWHCLEWHITLGASANMELFVDGTTSVETGTFDMRTTAGFSSVFIGQGTPAGPIPGDSLYLDQLIISRNRPGCDASIPAP